ncbi:hypothetical protein [Singulisphaera acidiphila]|uniref:hypothetical protein n=1 Tax=Singulisphaera acidiphila TaxID=466153 RepID=UPI0002FF409A|nr:hypothetical protein [Singulisphaera acidiphila]
MRLLNALERLADGYTLEKAHVEQDLVVAQGQFRDSDERVGKPFPHADDRAHEDGGRARGREMQRQLF